MVKKRREENVIYFYERGQRYYEFTNFYCGKPVVIDGYQWKTTEHYFQAQKFIGTPYVEYIQGLDRPRQAFDASRDPVISRWKRGDWEDVKQQIMYKALLAKFSQDEELRRLLAETGDKLLVENSPFDNFWGDGGNGRGQNHLGRLLMKVRALISVSGSSAHKDHSIPLPPETDPNKKDSSEDPMDPNEKNPSVPPDPKESLPPDSRKHPDLPSETGPSNDSSTSPEDSIKKDLNKKDPSVPPEAKDPIQKDPVHLQKHRGKIPSRKIPVRRIPVCLQKILSRRILVGQVCPVHLQRIPCPAKKIPFWVCKVYYQRQARMIPLCICKNYHQRRIPKSYQKLREPPQKVNY